MYARRFYRRPARKYLRKRKATGKRRPGVSSRIKKYVKKQIHRNIENKEMGNYAANTYITSGDIASGSMPLIPAVAQGTNEEQRIGNSIRVVKGTFKAVYNLLPYNTTTNNGPLPAWVKVWLVRDLRTTGEASQFPSSSYNNFFRAGSTGYSFNGNPLDICSEVNKDILRVLTTRTFKLGVTASITQTPIYGQSFLDNSPMSKTITINWGKYVKKALKFDEENNLTTNCNLYLVTQAVYADGTPSNGKNIIEQHYTNIMHFEDA